ncbi:hypothetical protein AB0F81_46315 [Actinoplanes sp. NPDC024001]|uniref:hypothetical protein n=1 Tax=Actinoplanes sp. NPDC024001 TaxID=3154598 RepID=UPI0033D3BE61
MTLPLLLTIALPAALAAAVGLPRCLRTIRDKRRPGPQPLGPPIQQLAADLRRLLRLHGDLTVSAHSALCAHRVWAVEAAIGARAIEAAAALDVPHPEPAAASSLTRTELSALLTALAEQGLVLPRRIGHFTTDGRL